jgi:hypothetical protein
MELSSIFLPLFGPFRGVEGIVTVANYPARPSDLIFEQSFERGTNREGYVVKSIVRAHQRDQLLPVQRRPANRMRDRFSPDPARRTRCFVLSIPAQASFNTAHHRLHRRERAERVCGTRAMLNPRKRTIPD